MSRTLRRLPYSCFRNPHGRVAALQRGDRAVPPSAWDDIPFGNDVLAPWTVAWRMAEDGREPEEIEEVLHDKFELSRWRTRDIARFVAETVARRTQMSISVDEFPQYDVARVAKALEDEVEAMREEFNANRHELCQEWVDYEVATTAPGRLNYTLVPRDFYERLARAVLRERGGC